MIRKSIHDINEVLSKVIITNLDNKNLRNSSKSLFYGDMIKFGSYRLQLFKTKGITCISCGIKGSFFAKERDSKAQSYHLNLYGYDNQHNEVLITKDHIIPVSKSGKDNLDNFQTMCVKCNVLKGNKYENQK